MIPRIGGQGQSFKGAALYYLHDKDALTDERVAFTETRNLPTAHPEMAWRLMVITAGDAERLKYEAGSPRTGRPSTKPVFTMSLSWHPEQKPDRAHMTEAMDSALEKLGLQDRQAFYVCHSDAPHSHIHAVVNLIHPETGRSAPLNYSKEALSRWAEAYEREHGIYCEQRIENNQKRDEAKRQKLKHQFPRYQEADPQEPAFNLKAEITRCYQSADNGKAFVAAVRELGYEVAQGNRLVLVGPDGKTHAIARQIEGVKTKQIRQLLAGIELPAVDEAREKVGGGDTREKTMAQNGTTQRTQRAAGRAEEAEYFDRDAYERDQDERIIDAGIAHEKGEAIAKLTNKVQDRQLDAWGAFYSTSHHERLQLDTVFEGQYGEHERQLRRDIEALDHQLQNSSAAKRWVLKATGKLSRTAEQDLEEKRLTLQNIEQRKAEARDALEARIEARRSEIAAQHGQARTSLPRDLEPRDLDVLVRSQRAEEATRLPEAPAAPAQGHVKSAEKTYEQLQMEYFNRLAGRQELDVEMLQRAQAANPLNQALERQATHSGQEAETGGLSLSPESYEAREAAYLRQLETDYVPAPEHIEGPTQERE